MAPRRLRCGICSSQDSKYTCPSCLIPYCSVKCFKEHKVNPCSSPTLKQSSSSLDIPQAVPLEGQPEPLLQSTEEGLPDPPTLRPLTSLKWPYIPEEPSYTDPLNRDEPKRLQLHHYQAIATSPAVRLALSSNPTLPPLLRRIDTLRGLEREAALEHLLGVITEPPISQGRGASSHITGSEEEIKAMKQLAEAVEKAVRGENLNALGLDWAEDT